MKCVVRSMLCKMEYINEYFILLWVYKLRRILAACGTECMVVLCRRCRRVPAKKKEKAFYLIWSRIRRPRHQDKENDSVVGT